MLKPHQIRLIQYFDKYKLKVDSSEEDERRDSSEYTGEQRVRSESLERRDSRLHRNLMGAQNRYEINELVSQLQPNAVEIDRQIAQEICVELKESPFSENNSLQWPTYLFCLVLYKTFYYLIFI